MITGLKPSLSMFKFLLNSNKLNYTINFQSGYICWFLTLLLDDTKMIPQIENNLEQALLKTYTDYWSLMLVQIL